jgi:hypothetical protein
MSKREKPLTILSFEARNVKRLKAVRIEPDPENPVVVLTGKNRQGKSSVIEAIFYALGGKDAIPSKPLRQGETEGFSKVDLGEYTVIRRFTEHNSYLEVKNKDGFAAPSPQTFLSSRLGGMAANPLEFLRLKSDQQVKALQGLIDIKFESAEFERISGLSLKGVKLDDPVAIMDQGYKHLYEKRTEINKEVSRLEGAVKTTRALIPSGKEDTKKVSATALVQERASLESIKTANDAKRSKLTLFEERIRSDAQRIYDEAIRKDRELRDRVPQLEALQAAQGRNIKEYDQEIDRLEARLVELRQQRDSVKEQKTKTDEALSELKRGVELLEEPDLEKIYQFHIESSTKHKELKAEVDALEDPDFSDIDARIAAADETNVIAGHVEQYESYLSELSAEKDKSLALTTKLDAIKEYKGKLIVEAGLPVEGLGFEDGEVTYKGLPLSQASGAEQIEICCAIAMAGHPEIGVLTIDVGWAELDSESRAVLIEWVKKTKTQIWLIKVTDEPGSEGFYIEDGMLAAVDGAPVTQIEEAPKAASLSTALAQAQADNPPEFPAVQDPIPF